MKCKKLWRMMRDEEGKITIGRIMQGSKRKMDILL